MIREMSDDAPHGPERELMIIAELARHQTWGFICPTLNFFIPFFFWRKKRHQVKGPAKIEAARGLLDFQLSWCLYLALPFVFLFPAIFSPAWLTFFEDYKLFTEGYSNYPPDLFPLAIPIAWGLIFLMSETLLTFIWVVSTLRVKKGYETGKYDYQGILKLHFFRKN